MSDEKSEPLHTLIAKIRSRRSLLNVGVFPFNYEEQSIKVFELASDLTRAILVSPNSEDDFFDIISGKLGIFHDEWEKATKELKRMIDHLPLGREIREKTIELQRRQDLFADEIEAGRTFLNPEEKAELDEELMKQCEGFEKMKKKMATLLSENDEKSHDAKTLMRKEIEKSLDYVDQLYESTYMSLELETKIPQLIKSIITNLGNINCEISGAVYESDKCIKAIQQEMYDYKMSLDAIHRKNDELNDQAGSIDEMKQKILNLESIMQHKKVNSENILAELNLKKTIQENRLQSLKNVYELLLKNDEEIERLTIKLVDDENQYQFYKGSLMADETMAHRDREGLLKDLDEQWNVTYWEHENNIKNLIKMRTQIRKMVLSTLGDSGVQREFFIGDIGLTQWMDSRQKSTKQSEGDRFFGIQEYKSFKDDTPDDGFLRENLGAILTKGLSQLVLYQPTDPVDYLANWLLDYRRKQDCSRYCHDEEEALKVERLSVADTWRKWTEDILLDKMQKIIDEKIYEESMKEYGEDNNIQNAPKQESFDNNLTDRENENKNDQK